MSEQKTKVADLPQNEQDALINEAKELDVRGLYTAMNVETLQRKIADARAAKNGEQTPAADEQDTENNEQNNVNGEQEPAADEQNAENVEQTPAADEPEKEETAPQVEKGEQRAYAKEKDAAPAVKVKICHICRSKVVNGKCTGCGFELKS